MDVPKADAAAIKAFQRRLRAHARRRPLRRRIPVAGDLGDQQAAHRRPGLLQSWRGQEHLRHRLLHDAQHRHRNRPQSKSGLLTTLCYKFGDQPAVYALEGSIAITGALVQWLRDNLEPDRELQGCGEPGQDGRGQWRHLLRAGLLRPLRPLLAESDARGAIVGMTRYVNKGHFARAALEATAYQTREVLDAMNKDSGVALTALKVDGGMVYNETLMQFQADVLGVPVVRPMVAETTALGAAYAAGLAVGFWSNFGRNARQLGQGQGRGHPRWTRNARTELYANWKKAVTRTFDWV